MKTSILILSSGTFAQLRTDTRDVSILIPAGMPTIEGLSAHARELRNTAARLLRDADFVDTGARMFAARAPKAPPCEK